ncbi:MAG TPA: alanine dehydrogenase, partial [Flavobacteriales bacterium]|nr:alanine dehydrogenase [Flavobacteriales bacterium]
LPCELPRDASKSFGRDLMDRVLPNLVGPDADRMIENATIARDGRLMDRFAYLADYAGEVV